jgi:hypothetical protein
MPQPAGLTGLCRGLVADRGQAVPGPIPEEVLVTPSNFRKVQITSLNFQIALRLLSIYMVRIVSSDIYVLDPELFYNSVLSSTL